MIGADPLAGLRDIHPPPAVSPWPPGPGWWVVAAVLAIAAVWLLYRLYRRYRGRAYRRRARRELDARFAEWRENGDAHEYLCALNAVLKRVAIVGFRRESVARLHGASWSDFLDRHWRGHGGRRFADVPGLGSLYSDRQPRADIADLHRLSVAWIEGHEAKPCWN